MLGKPWGSSVAPAVHTFKPNIDWSKIFNDSTSIIVGGMVVNGVIGQWKNKAAQDKATQEIARQAVADALSKRGISDSGKLTEEQYHQCVSDVRAREELYRRAAKEWRDQKLLEKDLSEIEKHVADATVDSAKTAVEQTREKLKPVTSGISSRLESINKQDGGGYAPSIIEYFEGEDSLLYKYFNHFLMVTSILVIFAVVVWLFIILFAIAAKKNPKLLDEVLSVSKSGPSRVVFFIFIGGIGYISWSLLWPHIAWLLGFTVGSSMLLAAICIGVALLVFLHFTT